MIKIKHEFHKKYDHHNKSHCFSLIALIGLVFFIVVGISYAAYLFIDATHVANPAGVHITKNLSLALNGLEGKLYSNEKLGIKDWMVHTERGKGFEIKHPNDWEMQENPVAFLHLKKYVSDGASGKSLAANIEANKIDLTENESVEQSIAKMGITWDNNWQEELIAGRQGFRTGKIKLKEGPTQDLVFWINDQDRSITYLRATYYKENYLEFEIIFNKIIAEFKFI